MADLSASHGSFQLLRRAFHIIHGSMRVADSGLLPTHGNFRVTIVGMNPFHGCIMMGHMPRSRTISPEAFCFGAIIERLRTERGWTKVKLAQRAGMNATYLRVLEQGGNDTSLTTIVELCDVLGADIGEVMREVAAVRLPKR